MADRRLAPTLLAGWGVLLAACGPCPPRSPRTPALITGGRTMPRTLLGRYEQKKPIASKPARAEHDRHAPALAAPAVPRVDPPIRAPNGPKLEPPPPARITYGPRANETPGTLPGTSPGASPDRSPPPGSPPDGSPAPPASPPADTRPPATLPDEVILRLIETGKPRFVRCFKKAFAEDPTTLSFKVRLVVELDDKAALTSATTDATAKALSDCLTRAAAWLPFPATGRRAVVEMPLFYRVE